MNPVSPFKSIVLLLSIPFLFYSCELFDDEDHCNFTAGKVETWLPGEYIIPVFQESEYQENFGKLKIIALDEKILEIDDVCTSKDVIISAEVEINSVAIEGLGDTWDCQLIVRNGLLNKEADWGPLYGYRIKLRRTNLDESILRLEPLAVPVSPDFSRSDLAGSLSMTLVLYFDTLKCYKSEVNDRARAFIDQLVIRAEVSAEYTRY